MTNLGKMYTFKENYKNILYLIILSMQFSTLTLEIMK